MDKRQAMREGLVEVQPYNYRKFSVLKDELKIAIAEARKKYNVRIVLVSTQSGSGYHRSFIHRAYAEPVLLDYLFLEQAEAEEVKFENERIKIEEEYRCKLEDIEKRHRDFFEKVLIAKSNVKKREEK